MEYDKINNLLLSENNESEQLSKFATTEYVKVNSLLNTYNEINQLDLKHPCSGQIYAIILMLIY